MKTKSKNPFPTLATISAKYGIHRNTVSKWFGHPDAPKRGANGFLANEVAAWIKASAERDSTRAKGDPAISEAKLAEILARVRKLDLANQRSAGELVQKVLVADAHRRILTRVKSLVYSKLENEYPPLFSNDLVSNRTLGKKLADQLIGCFQDLADEFEQCDKAS